MKTMLILMITLLTGTVVKADNPAVMSDEAMQSAEREYLVWHLKLHQHLLSSDNDNHKTLGLLALINGTLPAWREDQQAEPAASQFKAQMVLLNEILEINELSAHSLQILLGWCFREEIKPYCDHQMIISNLLHNDPGNLLSYVRPLQLAHQDLNDELLEKTLRLMGAARYSRQRPYLSADFIQVVDDYLANNPVPDSAIQAFKSDQALMSGIADVDDQPIDQRIRGYLNHAVKTSYLYLYSHDDLELVFKLCKLNPSFTPHCLNISRVLISHSDTIAAKGIGYAILMAVNQANNRPELVSQVAARQEQYKSAVACLKQAARGENFISDLMDPEYQRIKLLPLSQWEVQQQLAGYMYSKFKAADTNRTNPADCVADFNTEVPGIN